MGTMRCNSIENEQRPSRLEYLLTRTVPTVCLTKSPPNLVTIASTKAEQGNTTDSSFLSRFLLSKRMTSSLGTRGPRSNTWGTQGPGVCWKSARRMQRRVSNAKSPMTNGGYPSSSTDSDVKTQAPTTDGWIGWLSFPSGPIALSDVVWVCQCDRTRKSYFIPFCEREDNVSLSRSNTDADGPQV